MGEIVTTNMILKELKEFRAENGKRWEENEKRWEENNKRWEENDKRWEENNKRWEENSQRWEENDKRWEENNKKIDSIDERVKKLEKAKESDKQEVFRIMNSIDETIRSEVNKVRKELDVRFNKIEAILEENKLEHQQFKEQIKANSSRINLQQVRIEKLEDWKDELDTGRYLSV